jgi:Tol biopolymer transport system component
VLKTLPSHTVRLLPQFGFPGQSQGDPYLTSDGSAAAATAPRASSPVANRTVFVVDLVRDTVYAPWDSLPGNQFAAVWFPGDTLIAFLMDAPGGYEVFTSRADGSDLLQRTALGQNIPPFFDITPEGTLVLELHSDQQSDLYELTLSGQHIRRLTDTRDQDETFVAVSPDGARIAYVVIQNDISHVWLMHRDGSNPVRLLPEIGQVAASHQHTITPALSTYPSWTPDSKWVLVSWYVDAVRLGGSGYQILGDVYGVRLADGVRVRLTTSPWFDGQAFFR